MNKTSINRLVFLKRSYRTLEDLYNRLAQQIHLLMETGYVCVVFEINAGEGAIVLEFNPNSKNVELQRPHWLYPDEAEHLESYQRDVEIDNLEQELDELREKKELEEDIFGEEDELEEILKDTPKKKKDNKGDA